VPGFRNPRVNLVRGQLATLSRLEVTLVEFVLAGMDAIVDKESGKIDGELKEEMSKASTFWREKLPTIKEMADTEQKKGFARELGELYPSLEKAILTDLTQLITAKADKAAFDEIDDRIDNLGRKIDKPLMALANNVEKENAVAAQALTQQIDTASLVRRVLSAGMLLIISCALFLIARSILLPILAASALVRDVAQGEGDLTKRLQAGGDEIGTLAGHFNTFMDKLHGIISQVQSNLATLNTSAVSLSSLSQTLATGSEDATSRAGTVAAAAEEMSSNMNAVAAAIAGATVSAMAIFGLAGVPPGIL